MQSAQGSLTLIDVNTDSPRVFWNGEDVPVRLATVAGRLVFLRVIRGQVSAERIATLREAGIHVKEVA